MLSDGILYWIWLQDRCSVQSKEFPRLIDRFSDPFEIFRLEVEEIEQLDFISARLCDRLADKSLERAYSILKYCKDNGVDIVTYGDKDYPSSLRTLEDPPCLLYCKGRLPNFESLLCVGIVGTRKMSAYGAESAYRISYELAASNVCVVSGMALGIDAVAACAAIEGGGCTVAVLGCGIDIIYPAAHKTLANKILQNGAIITEFPPAEPPQGHNFPKRNRIISGLSQGVLVVEGNRSSGAMITAERAISQGRDVFALPGNINESNSDGPNELIRRGANVALCSDDVLYHFDFLYGNMINYGGHRRAKARSQFSPDVLNKYRVPVSFEYGLAQEPPKAKETSEAERTKKARPPERVEENTEEKTADSSPEILGGLDAVTRKVFEVMPDDRPVSPDEFTALGVGITDAMTSLTMLEISGLAVSLPGGKYIKK